MTETIEATLGKYHQLLGRHAELKQKLGGIGEELQRIGRGLVDGPEWVKFGGHVPARPFEDAEYLEPRTLKMFDEVQKMVEELRGIYPQLESMHRKLAPQYSFALKEPPKEPPNPFASPVSFV